MSQGNMHSGNGGNGASDFQLPVEILSVIPTDPYEQLDLARKITSMAIASRVSKLESDVGLMCQKLSDKDRTIQELEEKVSCTEQACQKAEAKFKMLLDENKKLLKERDSLAITAKKLSRDLGKLETFKRQLLQSLNDESSSPTETVDISTCEQSVPKAYPVKDDGTNGYVVQRSLSGVSKIVSTTDEALSNSGQGYTMTPYIPPRLTPTSTPKIMSTAGSPRGYCAAGSPQKTSGSVTPTNISFEGRNSLSSWYPSSQQSSAANSPPRMRPNPARTPRIDGKEFFRQARSRLSYEQFSAFLANVKELNAHKQTREETLRKAEEIFGTDNKDLFLSFQGLLSRNIH